MTTLFYETFQSVSKWVGGNNMQSSLAIKVDPLGIFDLVGTFNNLAEKPDTFSVVINNPLRSYTITFDYLGLPKNDVVAVNLGCVLSISDGSSLTDYTTAHYGAIKNAIPPVCSNKLIAPTSYYDPCTDGMHSAKKLYNKFNSFVFLRDNGQWNHYSLSFSANQENIRVALGDLIYANYPESGLSGDCYFANILVTDSYGPSEFIATAATEIFGAISVDVLGKMAETVSYTNSNAAVNVNLETLISTGGYANEDKFHGIKRIIGSKYNDQFIGDSTNNIFEGDLGDDIFTTSKGSDVFIGGVGKDKFIITENIDNTEISDFDLNNDSVDLSSFNKFYTLNSIIAVSSNVGGNTLITIESGKYLTLKGINFQDLKTENFLFSTHFPTNAPTLLPTLKPTEYPTISFTPTCQPSYNPTVTPTFSPTPKYIDMNIKSGGIFYGSEAQENFLVNSTRNTEIYGMGGSDKFTIFLHEYTTIKLMDFDATAETVDLHAFQNLRKFTDLGLTEDPLTLSLLNGQKVVFPNVDIEELSAGNFIFTDSISPIDHQQDSNGNDEIILGLSIGVGLLGITLIGIGCC